jgi:hypothetical protein
MAPSGKAAMFHPHHSNACRLVSNTDYLAGPLTGDSLSPENLDRSSRGTQRLYPPAALKAGSFDGVGFAGASTVSYQRPVGLAQTYISEQLVPGGIGARTRVDGSGASMRADLKVYEPRSPAEIAYQAYMASLVKRAQILNVNLLSPTTPKCTTSMTLIE